MNKVIVNCWKNYSHYNNLYCLNSKRNRIYINNCYFPFSFKINAYNTVPSSIISSGFNNFFFNFLKNCYL